MKSKFDREILDSLSPYSSEISISGENLVRLHANELPWRNESVITTLNDYALKIPSNRYP